MIGCMASFKALHLWFCITWVLFPVTRLCAHLHTQSKKQKPKCCFHIRHLEHAAKEDCSKCSFQFLSALQSFESSILLFSCCQLFKALQPASCFQKTKIQEISHSMALNLYCKKHFHTHQNVVLHVSKTYKN